MSKIVALHSFRGGSGKSIITANLASLAAMQGYRVGIVDTNLQNPGIHLLFGLQDSNDEPTLNQFLRGEVKIGEAAFDVGANADDALGRKSLRGKNIWLLPASMKGTEFGQIIKNGYDVNLLNEGVFEFTESMNLDYLFLDAHPGLSEETLLSIVISDMLIVNMIPKGRHFQGAAITIDIARSLEVPEIRVIVNKVLSKFEPDQIKAQIEKVYSTDVAGVLPFSEDVFEVDHDDIFALAYPEHPWSLEMFRIAENLF